MEPPYNCRGYSAKEWYSLLEKLTSYIRKYKDNYKLKQIIMKKSFLIVLLMCFTLTTTIVSSQTVISSLDYSLQVEPVQEVSLSPSICVAVENNSLNVISHTDYSINTNRIVPPDRNDYQFIQLVPGNTKRVSPIRTNNYIKEYDSNGNWNINYSGYD